MTTFLRRPLVAWLLVAAWMGVIFLFSAQPQRAVAPGPLFDYLSKKTAHLLSYAILAALTYRAARLTWPTASRGRAALAALAIAVTYAISDEVHQSFSPGRNPSPGDVGIDTLGALLGLALVVAWPRL
ncbi:MAG: VanZ family protein [Anaerolineae bacterium]|nr:VanZ family protein [Anaerolineae bacterium]